jgi:hypothetical protein
MMGIGNSMTNQQYGQNAHNNMTPSKIGKNLMSP